MDQFFIRLRKTIFTRKWEVTVTWTEHYAPIAVVRDHDRSQAIDKAVQAAIEWKARKDVRADEVAPDLAVLTVDKDGGNSLQWCV